MTLQRQEKGSLQGALRHSRPSSVLAGRFWGAKHKEYATLHGVLHGCLDNHTKGLDMDFLKHCWEQIYSGIFVQYFLPLLCDTTVLLWKLSFQAQKLSIHEQPEWFLVLWLLWQGQVPLFGLPPSAQLWMPGKIPHALADKLAQVKGYCAS